MLGPYKVEIFSRDMQFQSAGILADPTLQEDYLTLEGTSITVGNIALQKGDFAHVTDLYGDRIYQGIVSDIVADQGASRIKLEPLLSLLDIPVFMDREELKTRPLEEFIADCIRATYQDSSDTLQNIPGLQIRTTSSTQVEGLAMESNLHELWDIATRALTLFGIVIRADLDVQERVLSFSIGKATQQLTIESELPNCLSKNFVLTDDYGALNKVVYINAADEQETAIYYLHPDGTVDSRDEDRIIPVFFTVEYLQSTGDFAEEARSRAEEELAPQVYEQLIELTYQRNDPMIQPKTLEIGTQADILYGGKAYRSILTGYEITAGTITLIFGSVRMELTKKLILERRKRNSADT